MGTLPARKSRFLDVVRIVPSLLFIRQQCVEAGVWRVLRSDFYNSIFFAMPSLWKKSRLHPSRPSLHSLAFWRLVHELSEKAFQNHGRFFLAPQRLTIMRVGQNIIAANMTVHMPDCLIASSPPTYSGPNIKNIITRTYEIKTDATSVITNCLMFIALAIP